LRSPPDYRACVSSAAMTPPPDRGLLQEGRVLQENRQRFHHTTFASLPLLVVALPAWNFVEGFVPVRAGKRPTGVAHWQKVGKRSLVSCALEWAARKHQFRKPFRCAGRFQDRMRKTSGYFRRRVLRLVLPSRFAFAATRRRYRRTMSLPEAPVISRPPAWMAASIFSLTMSSASRRAFLPPCISFMQRKAMTRFDSSASIIKE